jgi:choline dehydrogenase
VRDVLTTRSHPSAAAPDLQIFPSAVTPGDTGPELNLLVALLRPRSPGRVRLASPDPGAAPDIDLGPLTDPDDLPRCAPAPTTPATWPVPLRWPTT